MSFHAAILISGREKGFVQVLHNSVFIACWTDGRVDHNRLALGNVHHPSKRAELERMIDIKKRYRARVKELGGRGFVGNGRDFYLGLLLKENGIRVMYSHSQRTQPDWLYVPTRKAAETLKAEFSFEEVSLMLRYLA